MKIRDIDRVVDTCILNVQPMKRKRTLHKSVRVKDDSLRLRRLSVLKTKGKI